MQALEAFIRDRASLGWSRQWVCEILEISPQKLTRLTKNMSPIPWPKPSRSAGHRLHWSSIEGLFPEYLQKNQEKAIASRSAQAEKYNVCGVVASIKDLYMLWGEYVDVSESQVRRRLSAGKDVYEALFASSAPRDRRNQGRRPKWSRPPANWRRCSEENSTLND